MYAHTHGNFLLTQWEQLHFPLAGETRQACDSAAMVFSRMQKCYQKGNTLKYDAELRPCKVRIALGSQ